jgi:predicted O-methyltransferase YrrM
MRGTAVSPDFAADLLSLIRRVNPRYVLEAGSGVSTLITGYALKTAGRGHLTSLEEDAPFADLTRSRVIEHGLESFVTVVHAPLKNMNTGNRDFTWYDIDSIRDHGDIDLLIVDGPRQDKNPTKHVRYPALPILFSRLSQGAAVIVDDCHRPDEQETVERWLREFQGLQADPGRGEKQHVVLRRRPSTT